MSVKRLLSVLGLIAIALGAIGAVGAYYINLGRGFTPTTDTFIFERDVRFDHGDALDPNTLVSVDEHHVRLLDVLTKDTVEQRYGADTIAPDGVGLEVLFRVKRGETLVREETFSIPAWQRFEETSNEDRRRLVVSQRSDFGEVATKFASPINTTFSFAVVVDTTEGVNEMLVDRVKETVTETVGDLADGKSIVYCYTLHEFAYQGTRRKISPSSSTDMINQLDSFLAAKGAAGQSSVLRGVRDIVTDLGSVRKGEPIRVDIWTDGLENTEELSAYQSPTLLEPGPDGWDKLDGAWNSSGLDLRGYEIHLHPLPPKSQRYEVMMAKGLEYLRDRLTAAGASVAVEAM